MKKVRFLVQEDKGVVEKFDKIMRERGLSRAAGVREYMRQIVELSSNLTKDE